MIFEVSKAGDEPAKNATTSTCAAVEGALPCEMRRSMFSAQCICPGERAMGGRTEPKTSQVPGTFVSPAGILLLFDVQ